MRELKPRIVAAVHARRGDRPDDVAECLWHAVVGRAALAMEVVESTIKYGIVTLSPGPRSYRLKMHAWLQLPRTDELVDFSSYAWQGMADEPWSHPPPHCIWGDRRLLVGAWLPPPALPRRGDLWFSGPPPNFCAPDLAPLEHVLVESAHARNTANAPYTTHGSYSGDCRDSKIEHVLY
jgi:hypothetical protein